MSDEQEELAKSLVRKLLGGEKLTTTERDLLDSSDMIMSAVIQELASPNGSRNGYPGTSPNGISLGLPEREAAEQALGHGKAVLMREFPGIFEDTV